jgi:Uma2 family endonuclease
MKAVIQDLPKRWLEERRASDASRYDEVWEGVLHMAPAPNMDHQELAIELSFLLKSHWEPRSGGRVFYEVNVTTPEDESTWTTNYRIPDMVMLSADRLAFRKTEYICGPPLVCIEFHSPGDEAYEKLPFYAKLGVPEVWIIHRDTKEPEIHLLEGRHYKTAIADRDGWLLSPATGIRLRAEKQKLLVFFEGDTEAKSAPK